MHQYLPSVSHRLCTSMLCRPQTNCCIIRDKIGIGIGSATFMTAISKIKSYVFFQVYEFILFEIKAFITYNGSYYGSHYGSVNSRNV